MRSKIKCEVIGYENIEFEVGQKWKTRRGEVFKITAVFTEPSLSYPIEAGSFSYTRTGEEFKHRKGENDLVELVAEPVETYKDNADLWEDLEGVNMKCKIKGYENIEFEVGQVWLDGCGSKVTIESIMAPNAATFNIIGNNGRSYTLTGIYRFDLERTEDDLVSLHVEESDEEPVAVPVEEPVEEPVEDWDEYGKKYEEYEEPVEELVDSRLEIVGQVEPAIEDKMAGILIQLLSQRDKDLEKLSLVFNTYIQLEKMR